MQTIADGRSFRLTSPDGKVVVIRMRNMVSCVLVLISKLFCPMWDSRRVGNFGDI